MISQAIEALSSEGPALGRPLVDAIKGSALPNLKELRPGSAGASEGGDKSDDWRGWYRTAIPSAETAYADHLKRMTDKGEVDG